MKVEPHEHLPPGITDDMFHDNKLRARCSSMYHFMRLAGYTPDELLLRYYRTSLGLIAGVEVLPQAMLDYHTPQTRKAASREELARYPSTPINGGP